MPYSEFAPDPSLAHVVKCVFAYHAEPNEKGGRPECIVPDGHPELVIHFGFPFTEIDAATGKKRQPRAFIMGQMSKPLDLDPSQGIPALIGVRFRPWGLRAFLGAAMGEFTDLRLNVADLAPARTESLVDEIACARTHAQRAAILQRFVATFIEANERFQDTLTTTWSKRLMLAGGDMRLTSLARECDLSLRQLERRFQAQVGMTPRLFSNIVRFRSVFDKLNGHDRPDWVNLANDAGYFDQSHMNRDFRRFLGLSPSTYVTQLRGLVGAPLTDDDEATCRVVTRREAAA
jgi:AraC-like DNA-binding protein